MDKHPIDLYMEFQRLRSICGAEDFDKAITLLFSSHVNLCNDLLMLQSKYGPDVFGEVAAEFIRPSKDIVPRKEKEVLLLPAPEPDKVIVVKKETFNMIQSNNSTKKLLTATSGNLDVFFPLLLTKYGRLTKDDATSVEATQAQEGSIQPDKPSYQDLETLCKHQKTTISLLQAQVDAADVREGCKPTFVAVLQCISFMATGKYGSFQSIFKNSDDLLTFCSDVHESAAAIRNAGLEPSVLGVINRMGLTNKNEMLTKLVEIFTDMRLPCYINPLQLKGLMQSLHQMYYYGCFGVHGYLPSAAGFDKHIANVNHYLCNPEVNRILTFKLAEGLRLKYMKDSHDKKRNAPTFDRENPLDQPHMRKHLQIDIEEVQSQISTLPAFHQEKEEREGQLEFDRQRLRKRCHPNDCLTPQQSESKRPCSEARSGGRGYSMEKLECHLDEHGIPKQEITYSGTRNFSAASFSAPNIRRNLSAEEEEGQIVEDTLFSP